MLSYISNTLFTPWLCHNIKPVNSKHIVDGITISEYFAYNNDVENMIHLLQDDSADITLEITVLGMIDDLRDIPFAIRHYKAIGDALIEDMDIEPYVHLLYKCYQMTDNKDYRDSIVYRCVCHVIEDPLTEVTPIRIEEALATVGLGEEIMYLFKLLSPNDQQVFINELEVKDVLDELNITQLKQWLPYLVNKDYYRVAYACAHKASLPFTEVALQPAEYFVARKYTNWTGQLLNTDKSCLRVTVMILAEESDKALIEEMNQYVVPKIVVRRYKNIMRDV